MVPVKRVQIGMLIVCAMILGPSLNAVAQNKVVVIPLMDDGITCKGTLVGTRWCDNGDATVTDMTTGLVWLQFADWGGQKPWRSDTSGDHDDADTRAGTLEDGVVVHYRPPPYFSVKLSDGSTQGDWRLPTKSEFNHIAHGTDAVGNNNMRAFRGVEEDFYWTSTTDKYRISSAYVMPMHISGLDPLSSDKYNAEIYVWPVRGGN